MVVSKEGKRRRKVTTIAQTGGSNPTGGPASTVAVERDLSPPDIPKRPKVHAQRKFAQGQGAPSSSYLNYSTAPPTPAKDAQNNRNSASAGNNIGTATAVSGGGTGSESTPQVTELLPNMRPNTEDFLTFLCFRGTPVLPPALDFFNKNANATATNSGGGSAHPAASTSGTSGATAGRQKLNDTAVQSSSAKAKNQKKPAPPVSSDSKEVPAESKGNSETSQEKPPATAPATYIPFAVRKRAEQHPAEARPDRKRTQDKMQALRKKYHDQRVAKLLATNQGKQITRGGTAAVTTRSSKAGAKKPAESSENEEMEEEEKPHEAAKKSTEDVEEDDDDDVDDAKGVRKEKEQTPTEPPTGGKRKSGLRSGSVVPPATSPVTESGKVTTGKSARGRRESPKQGAKEDPRKEPPAKPDGGKTPNKSKKSPSPDQSTEETPKGAPGRAVAGGSKRSTKASPPETPKHSPSQQASTASESEGREKRTTRLSALRSPPAQSTVVVAAKLEDKASPNASTKEKERKQPTPVQERVDESSDDDEPLSRSARTEKRSVVKETAPTAAGSGKTTRSGRSRKSEPAVALEKESDETPDKKLRRSESVVSRRSDISSRKSAELRDTTTPAGKKTPQQQQRGRKRKDTTAQSDPNNEHDSSSPAEATESSPVTAGRKQATTAAAAVASKKKRETPAPEPAKTPDVSMSPSEMQEERKQRTAPSTPVESLGTGRPSRKTKEAATLYMELIGRKFNHEDKSDDDASSLDSLELPNVRKLERMENELKANAGKRDTKHQQQSRQAAATGGGKTGAAGAKNAKATNKQAAGEAKKKKANADESLSQTDEGGGGGGGKVVERSFSDSDEEPLASKFQRKKQQMRQQQQQQSAATKGKQPGGRAAKASPAKRASAASAAAAAKAKLVQEESQSSEQDQSPEKRDPQVATKVEELTTVNASSPASPPTMASTPRGTPKRVPASPVGKQNGTTLVPATTAAVASSTTPVGLKTPTRIGAKLTPNIPHESPASKVVHPKEPDGSQSSSRLNKSLDNTHLSMTVEASESPMKIPQVLNIPTVLTSPVHATPSTTPQHAPFTRTVKPANATANNAGLDSAAGSHYLEKSPTTGPNHLSAGAGVDSIPFNRPAPVVATKAGDFISLDEADFLKGFEQSQSPTDPSAPVKSNSLLGNLLPSKEESEKIFGIASVSLAQSSGPLDTKCTLGKCGSVHKPPLGPPVLTESLLGGNLSPRDRRKAKVNMTHEQIQKWIDESSWSPIEDDLKDVDGVEVVEPGGKGGTASASTCPGTTPPPATAAAAAPAQASVSAATQAAALAWERLNAATESGGISDPIIGASVPATSSTPLHTTATVVGNGRTKEDNDRALQATLPAAGAGQQRPSVAGKTASHTTDQLQQQELSASGATKTVDLTGSKTAANEQQTSVTPSGRQKKDPTTTPTTTTATGKREVKETRKTKVDTSGGGSSIATNVAQSRSPATTPTTGDRKPIYRTATGRTPVYKQEAPPAVSPASKLPSASLTQATNLSSTPTSSRPPPPAMVAAQGSSSSSQHQHQQQQHHQQTNSNKFGAFSPVNEPSVYSFDKEEDFMPVATPFRRQHSGATGRRESCNSSARDEPTTSTGATKREPTPVVPDEKVPKVPATIAGVSGPSKGANAANVPSNVGPLSSGTAVSLTPSPSENVKSSAAVVLPAQAGGAHRARGEAQEKKKAAEDETPTRGGAVKAEAASTSDTEADAGGQTFYIPLQGPSGANASGTTGGKSGDQLIQGVAVKLGTEGPDGPNQRVIMHAKLVTKAEMGSNPTTLPDSMNVQELVKSLTQAQAAGGSSTCALSKEGLSKLVPIGTVQPRFKSTTDAASAATSAPAEGRNSAEPPVSRGGLSRINSNSSLSSQRSKPTKAGGAANAKAKGEPALPPQPDNNTVFPRRDDPAQMVEAPVFKPTEKEFQDPMEYIERIAPVASRFGICRIIPPASFKPECRIADDMRFMAYNQYVHKMLHRWGPSAKEYAAIKKYLATQSINLQAPPVIGGMEVDLPRLYHTVQELGGLKEVIEKKRWARVSEDMCIPKAAHDRVSKLDDIYCKYLLPYDTLSPAERQKLFDEVEADWAKREAKARRNADKGVGSEIRNSGDSDEDEDEDEDDEEDDDEDFSMECIVKGRNMPLNQFFRIARNTMSLWFKNSEPTVAEIEAEYWRHVAVRDSHVCVHSGSIDSSAFGFGFPSPKVKGSSCAKHPWNLKVLTNHSGSILRSLGPVMGITIPTLHVGMLFSACCWYRDPHGLPWVEYLHTGANKIWYGVPDDQNANFRAALTVLVPTHCQNKTIWLPCDTAMVPPHMLTDRTVSLCRTEQQPGQFVVVFPRAYTSSLCTGYAVSESVYFATNSWLDTAKDDFRDIQESCEPTMFSVEQLLFAIANDQRSNHDTLVQAYPLIVGIYEKEKLHRQTLKEQGVTKSEKIESKKKTVSLEEFECERCRANLYLSLVKVKVTRAPTDGDNDGDDDDDESTEEEEEERIYCLKHAVKHLVDGGLQTKHCRLAYTYSLEEIEELLKRLQDRIANKKSSKSSAAGSSAGGAGGGAGGGGGAATGGGGKGKSSLHLASTSSQSSSSYQAPSHSKFAGMATMLK